MPVEKILVTLDKDVATQFRAKVFEVYGVERGALSKAVEEAVKLWIARKRT